MTSIAAASARELRERICRLVCVPVRYLADVEAAGPLLDERGEHPWGGYTFFGCGLGPARALITKLRETAAEPLFLAADLERGVGQQLAGGTTFPPPMALGAASDPELAREVGVAIGREAAGVGLNWVFAPVLDLVNEPANPIVCTRAFGDDPEAVAELGAAVIRGFQAGGVLATAKHFPGHGRTLLDSHDVLPVVATGAAELHASDIVPFRRAVEAGVACIMSAHVAFPGLERGAETAGSAPPVPATLSRAILTDLLRGELGFRGAVVSDALIMGAVVGGDPGALAARALEAGIDCLLYPPNPRELVEALARRLEEGRLEPGVIERAEANLAAALARLDGTRTPEPLAPGAGQDLARHAAARGIVALGDPRLPPAGRSLVLLLLDGGVAREDVVLPAVLAAPGREFRWLVPAEEPALLPEGLAAFDAVALAWFSPIRGWKGRAGPSAEAAAFARTLLAARPDAVLISFSSPFILAELPAARAAILAFGEAPVCQLAAGEALAGRARLSGRLPVRL